MTPTQYTCYRDGVIIMVGRPQSKTWWRNFRCERDIEILLDGQWIAMTARAVVGAQEPETIAQLRVSGALPQICQGA